MRAAGGKISPYLPLVWVYCLVPWSEVFYCESAVVHAGKGGTKKQGVGYVS